LDTSAKTPSGTPDNLPFPRSYWAEPGKLLAGCYPGADSHAFAEEKLQGLIRCGVTCVVSLMDAKEKDRFGKPFVPYQPHLEALAQQKGIVVVFHRLPIVDMNIPTVAGMRAILDTIDSAISAGHIVYVHCWGGRGRTGTVIGCYLLRHRLVPEGGALDRVMALTEHRRKEFQETPQTTAQCHFVSAWKYGK